MRTAESAPGLRRWVGLNFGLVIGLAAAAGLVATGAGCNKASKGKKTAGSGAMRAPGRGGTGKGVTCTFPAKMLKSMRKAAKGGAVDDFEVMEWRFMMKSACKGWPPLLAKIFKIGTRAPKVVNGKPVMPAPPKVTAADRKDMRERLERMCPGYGAAAPPAQRDSVATYRKLWSVCKLDGLKLFSRREFLLERPMSLILVAMYRELRDGGMEAGVARLLVRGWLSPDEWRERLRALKLQLPESRSTTQLLDLSDVVVSAGGISVRQRSVANVQDWKVASGAKRDGPDGYFIDPLFKTLRDENRKYQAAVKQGAKLPLGGLVLVVDRRASYRLLAEVLYTATQAGFTWFQMLVDHPEVKHASVLVSTPKLALSRKGRPALPPTAVEVTAKAYRLKVAGKLKQTIAIAPGKRAAATAALIKALQTLRASAKADAAPARILVSVASDVSLADLVRTLDAVREMPRGGPGAPSSKPLPDHGCRLRYDRQAQQWTVPAASRPACLFPFVVLGVLAR